MRRWFSLAPLGLALALLFPGGPAAAQESGTSAVIVQDGTANLLALDQHGPAQVRARQDGADLLARIVQQGENAILLLLDQRGLNSRVEATQHASGRGIAAAIAQRGTGNLLVLEQEGSDNTAHLSQTGNGDIMSVRQTGSGNTLRWDQNGDYLADLRITQTGGAAAVIAQVAPRP